MKTTRIVLLVMIVVARLLLHPQAALACSCMAPGAPQAELEGSAAVFAGTVANIQQPPVKAISSSMDPAQVTFEVSQVWKGPEFTNLAVTTTMDGASCGYSFEFGRDYLVYAHGAEENLEVSLCSRTQLLADAQVDLTELGEAVEPTEANPSLPASPDAAAPPDATPSFWTQVPTILLWGIGLAALALAVIGGLFMTPKPPRRKA